MDLASVILWSVLGFMVLLIIGLVIFMVSQQKKYRNLGIIKKSINGVIKTVYAKYAIKHDKSGNEYYRFLKKALRKKYKTVAPLPDECIEVGPKGEDVGVWYDIDGSLVPAKDNFNSVDKSEVIAACEPFTANQRSFYINQYEKAERDKKKSWTDVAIQALPFATLIILVVIAMAMLPDLFTERNDYDAARNAEQIKILEIQQGIVRDLVRIANDQEVLLSDNVTMAVNNMEAPN